jgi:excisionase family DNA binding protein
LTSAGGAADTAPVCGRVLVVDDEAAIGRILVRALSPPHEVVYAPTAAAALEQIARDPEFDVVLCDLVLPGTSGMGFVSALRERAPALSDRIAILSGDVTPATRAFAAEGRVQVFEKPMDVDGLRAFVAGRVAARRTTAAPAGLLTTQEAAELLGLSPATVKRWSDAGLLETRRTVGGHRRFVRAALERFRPATNESAARASPDAGWVAKLLDPGGVVALEAAMLEARSRAETWCAVAEQIGPAIVELHRMREQRSISALQWAGTSERLGRAAARFTVVMPRPRGAAEVLVALAPGDPLPGLAALVELCVLGDGCAVRWAGSATSGDVSEECARDRPDAVLVVGSFGLGEAEASRHALSLASAQPEIGRPVAVLGLAPWPEAPPVRRLHGVGELREWLAGLRAPGQPGCR